MLTYFFLEFTFNFLRYFSSVFRRLLREFAIFLKRFSALKFPLIATEYFSYYSRHIVESIKLKITIKAKWDKTEEGRNEQLFIKLFALSGLESNYD